MSQTPDRQICKAATEIMPWLLNGSLEESEERSLRAHLAACAGCRRELAETAEAAALFGQHVPSLALAEYAQDLVPSEVDRERIERHVALCPSCRQELEWATPGQVVDFEEAREARRGAPRRRSGAARRSWTWHRWALAASVAFAVTSASLVLRLRDQGVAPTDDGARETRSPASLSEPPGDSAQEWASVLFRDGFESGNLTNWSGARTDVSVGENGAGTESGTESGTE